ncbi:5-formyltetrahydrofolate cyclo-ligase [Leuconostoc inhae]|uniref:5-formyltetrahydrofolate cyclo-ligase n=1 Tax=Leuconostoc inhae TaxID=178001 RepID=UPI001C7CD43A|nr:5-formyltetrahydrofolate cyclo-ligase [Leuconostoc inhae]
MLDKKVMRTVQKQRLANYVGYQRTQEEMALRELLFSSNQWQKAQIIAVVLSTAIEINTQPIIERAWSENKRTVVPKIINRQMVFVEITSRSSFSLGQMNIKEPIDSTIFNINLIDLVIVPGLAFTIRGERLGFGAGYYDRFLSVFSGDTVSLVLNVQLVTSLPLAVHDQKVSHILIQSQ